MINFKGKYLIQVPKQAFQDPKNPQRCEDDFEERFAEEFYRGKNFFQRRKEPFYAFLEAPMYSDIINSTTCGLHWVRQHTGIDVKSPISPDYHSFVVLTGEEGRALREEIKPKKLKEISEDISLEQETRENKGQITDEVWLLARTYSAFCEMLENCTKNSKQTDPIVIENLDEIPKALNEMNS